MAKKLKYNLGQVEALMQGEGGDAASAWLHRGQGSVADLSPEDAASAIEAAVRMERADRVAAASVEARDKAVRKFAAAGLHKLRSAGIEVPQLEQAGRWTLGEESIEVPPPVALVGMPTPEGDLPFVIIAFGAQEAVAFAGMFGAGQGFREVHHNHLGRSQARNMAYDAKRAHDLHELPPHVALHFMQRAFEEAGRGEPHEWDHLTRHFDEGLKNAARVIDPMRGQPEELDEAALADVGPLLDPRLGVVFSLGQEAGGRGLMEVLSAVTSELELNDETRRRRLKEALDRVSDEALTDEARRNWALAMDVVAWTAHRDGRAEVARVTRHTALALKAGRPGHQVPFVRAWVEKQLAAASELAGRPGPDGQTLGERISALKEQMELD